MVCAGIIIWLLAQRIPPPKDPASLRLGWIVGTLGVGIVIIGVYSGVKGPVSIGGVTVEAFSLKRAADESRAEAMRYARNNLRISSRPAVGWHGASQSDLTCEVENRGDRSITSLTFNFVTTDHKSINIKVRGPYPAGATKSVLVSLPGNVVRSYFTAGMNVNQISAASF